MTHGLSTPIHVRQDPRYATPVLESAGSRRSRLGRRRTAKHRALASTPTRASNTQLNTMARQLARLDLSEEARAISQAVDTARRHDSRGNLTATVVQEIRASNTTARRSARRNLPPERAQAIRQADLARRHQPGNQVRQGLVDLDSFVETAVPATHLISRLFAFRCDFCGAAKTEYESTGFCCLSGKVRLANEPVFPAELRELFESTSDQGKAFRHSIRKFNQAFAFTSMGASVDPRLASGQQGNYVFRVHGELMHFIGPSRPGQGRSPEFLQMYLYDSSEQDAVRMRSSVFQDLDPQTLLLIYRCLKGNNPFIRTLRHGKDVHQLNDFSMVIRSSHGKDRRRYNAPSANEVAAIIPGDFVPSSEVEDGEHGRDIIIRPRGGGLKRISELSGAYDPLSYPLLFPCGSHGWHPGIRYHGSNSSRKRDEVTLLDYVVYKLQIRPGTFNPILMASRLFQQYIVDQYCKIEIGRMNWLRRNQATIRADLYNGLEDFISALDGGLPDARVSVGTRFILPASHPGSPRYNQQLYQDDMAIVREFGKPDLFVTITCNPAWEEIASNLLPGQTASDRPDIVCRAFKAKLECIMKDLIEESLLGRVHAHMSVIEFQKRGLPHCHLLLILSSEDKLRHSDDMDRCVSAELPDATTQSSLHAKVKAHMMHGPCGSMNPENVCMVEKDTPNGRRSMICSKDFPKVFVSETTLPSQSAYPVYRRRDNQRFVEKKGHHLDNRWVVPYNPYLLEKYNCHINVEICSTIASIKYLHKYIHKGNDRAAVAIGRDEIQEHLDSRYVSPPDAFWKIAGYKMHKESHNVVRLSFHLPKQQRVIFDTTQDLSVTLERNKETQLLQFFSLCSTDEYARRLSYLELPKHYTWKATDKKWARRVYAVGEKTIGRLYMVQPGGDHSNSERYFLRLLLCVRCGPRSYEDLRTVNGVTHDTFRAAAIALGLLEDDQEWIRCLEEARAFRMPSQLRHLFASILLFCAPTNIGDLWIRFVSDLSEDYLHRYRDAVRGQDISVAKTLEDIQKVFISNGKDLSDYPQLPILDETLLASQRIENTLLQEELSYAREELRLEALNADLLNDSQKVIFDEVLDLCLRGEQGSFFVDGPGGTGKSFLFSALLATVRLTGKVALAVASSGIAATLLAGGRTAHSRFKIPLSLSENSFCPISIQSNLAELLRATSLIVWDEAPMADRKAIECVDRTLRDLRKDNRLFGGLIVLFGGDFRQVLPVIPKASRAETVASCLRRSYIWRSLQIRQLSHNMRVTQSLRSVEYASYLLDVGNGAIPLSSDDLIPVRDDLLSLSTNLEQFIQEIYPDDILIDGKSAILTPKNEHVEEVNAFVVNQLDGVSVELLSSNTIAESAEANHSLFPVEFLQSLMIDGLPPHRLELKIGTIVMLIRNMDPFRGLCNGTRLRILEIRVHVLRAEILTGDHAGDVYFIPRITLSSNEGTLPFTLLRRQFPVRIAYAMTINKSQGQSLDRVGLFLPYPVFAHGQLYVALSRCRDPANMKIFIPSSSGPVTTRNVVYTEVLQ